MTHVLVADKLVEGLMNFLVMVSTGSLPRINDATPSSSLPGFGEKKGRGDFQMVNYLFLKHLLLSTIPPPKRSLSADPFFPFPLIFSLLLSFHLYFEQRGKVGGIR